MTEDSYKGNFRYVGGEPDWKPRPHIEQLLVTRAGIECYHLPLLRRGAPCVLTIAPESVKSVTVNGDSVTMNCDVEGVSRAMRFQAWGATPRRDVARLCSAMTGLLGGTIEIIDAASAERERKRHRRLATIWKGTFNYAGGHPDARDPGSHEVVVTSSGIEWIKRSWSGERVYQIQREEIVAVRHVQHSGGGGVTGAGIPVLGVLVGGAFGEGPDHFIEVDMIRGGRTFTVRFKAEGFTRQKDAFAFYAAANSILAQEAGGHAL